jgi:glycerol dehydrogenase
MTRILIAPRRYVQGSNELERFGEHVGRLGTSPFVISWPADFDRVGPTIIASAARMGLTMMRGDFRGELTRAEAARLSIEAAAAGSNVIVGLGGGKACDAAKKVASQLGLPNVTIPTIASTDAPCSSLAVFYTEEGVFESGEIFKHNPDLVLVDSMVIAHAPTRFLVSGFGDALATYFEARAAHKTKALNIPGGQSTIAALAIAHACLDVLLTQSLDAVRASEANEVTDALEDVIEANVLLSGIGFESGGLAAAHSIHNGLTAFEQTHRFLHGEKVAFGVIVQLVLDQADEEEIGRVVDYLRSVGLPTNLADLDLPSDDSTVHTLARATVAPRETIHNMSVPIDVNIVAEAIIEADRRASAHWTRARI